MDQSDGFDLSSWPPVFVLPAHLQTDDLHEIEDLVYRAKGQLTYNAKEARIFLGKVVHKKRAAFELRSRGLWTEETKPTDHLAGSKRKRPIREGSDSDSNVSHRGQEGHHRPFEPVPTDFKSITSTSASRLLENDVVVLQLEWLYTCVTENTAISFEHFVVYHGKMIPKPEIAEQQNPSETPVTYIKAQPDTASTDSSPRHAKERGDKLNSIIARVGRGRTNSSDYSSHLYPGRRRFGQRASPTLSHNSYPPKLHRTTTSEFEELSTYSPPSPPAWMLEPPPRPMYSCLRATPADNPNAKFISQLTKIKEARLLTLDEIGVRAYSTSIASLSAYPYRVRSPIEITRLPGCDQKIATLWLEWYESRKTSTSRDVSTVSHNSRPPSLVGNVKIDDSVVDDAALDAERTIPVVAELEADTDLQHLRTFWNIWGVGADTARKFYYTNGWKDLDDIIEFGWTSLTRVQQIGVKFYDEFQMLIPREESESIAATVLTHARKVRNIPQEWWSSQPSWLDGKGQHTDPRDFVAVLVGGYRRGKSSSGDVDIILSHRDERQTHDLVIDLVQSLEEDGYITHTLTLHTTTSDRGGTTLPFRAAGHAGHGFDSLDKALCVWQNPSFNDEDEEDDNSTENGTLPGKNSNTHRRVDIIISPWKTVGCAVLGWSGGTTFQRDVRRWAKRERGWKFDSSGVRDRRNGLVVELEAPPEDGSDPSDGWEDRERRAMQGLGIGWRAASERCTG